MIGAVAGDLETRARLSRGASEAAIYRVVGEALRRRGCTGVVADVGCGSGDLWRELQGVFSRCVGVDAIRYEALPADVEFHQSDLDGLPLPLPDGAVDVAAAIETIEHLENPRAFCRELTRVTRRGGWVVVTTPNQLSLLSLLTLIVKQRFSAFQDSSYPAHRTALLEVDLRRLADECGLRDVEVRYTSSGRVPLSAARYPPFIARRFPRACSDNVLLIGRRGA